MNVKDNNIRVVSVTDDMINIEVGINGYQIAKAELEELAYGLADDFETIKRNIAVAVNLAGVPVSNDIALKAVIEGRPFKARR
jgi:hypothetical protein